MNLITDFTNGLVSKLYSPKGIVGQKKSWIDIESQNIIKELDDYAIIEPKNQRVVNIFVNDETNEYDANNMIVGS